MSRINTNVSAMIAQQNLAKSNKSLAMSLERLSTGLQINRGSDDPAGLIVSERLRSEIQGVGQAVENAERAVNVIATAEAALDEVSNLLNDMRGLIVEAANTGAFSPDEMRANQLQIDSAIESITRISNTTSFAGLQLLNGSLDYQVSGVDSDQLKNVKVHGANFGTNSFVPVTVEVLQSANVAQLYISGNMAGSAGELTSSVTFEVQGNKGVQVFSFVSGTSLSAVAFALNQTSDATGVSASLRDPGGDQTSGLVLTSVTYGSDAFVSVRKLDDGDFFETFDSLAAMGGTPAQVQRDTGEDVLALINGSLSLGEGLDISMNTSMLNVEMRITEAANTTGSPYTFDITGGGALFQVGPSVNTAQQIGFGIQSVAASRLGNEDVGYLSSVTSGGDNSLLNSRFTEASEIVEEAIDQISIMRGKLGAFERNTLQTSIRSQTIALENLTASESSIRDTDFAKETSNMTRAQILTNAGTSVLSMANNSAQSVLSLLG